MGIAVGDLLVGIPDFGLLDDGMTVGVALGSLKDGTIVEGLDGTNVDDIDGTIVEGFLDGKDVGDSVKCREGDRVVGISVGFTLKRLKSRFRVSRTLGKSRSDSEKLQYTSVAGLGNEVGCTIGVVGNKVGCVSGVLLKLSELECFVEIPPTSSVALVSWQKVKTQPKMSRLHPWQNIIISIIES